LDILKNDSYQNYIRLAYLEKTKKTMVEEDVEETETPTYTFSTWKKQVAVGAEGFEDLVESVLGLESKYSAHEKNTQIHTSQSEKDNWNAKAVIKGLERGATELKYGLDLNTLSGNSCYLAVNGNLPIQNEFALVTTNTNGVNDTGMQVANFLAFGKVYERSLQGGVWQPWKLIAQDQEGVAKIKGLESVNGVEEKLNTWNGFDDIITCEYIIQGGNKNAPNADWGILKTRTNGSHAGYQEYRTINGYVYHRFFGSAKWGSWKLISAPKMFATGYIDSVTFNGTTPIIKSVLFDDGVIRDITFNKDIPAGFLYNATCTDPNVFIIAISGTGIVSILAEKFSLLNYGVNPPSYITDYGATILRVQVTIKL
jgi:hypothetical protein